jgi:hypothetical protein
MKGPIAILEELTSTSIIHSLFFLCATMQSPYSALETPDCNYRRVSEPEEDSLKCGQAKSTRALRALSICSVALNVLALLYFSLAQSCKPGKNQDQSVKACLEMTSAYCKLVWLSFTIHKSAHTIYCSSCLRQIRFRPEKGHLPRRVTG